MKENEWLIKGVKWFQCFVQNMCYSSVIAAYMMTSIQIYC